MFPSDTNTDTVTIVFDVTFLMSRVTQQPNLTTLTHNAVTTSQSHWTQSSFSVQRDQTLGRNLGDTATIPLFFILVQISLSS